MQRNFCFPQLRWSMEYFAGNMGYMVSWSDMLETCAKMVSWTDMLEICANNFPEYYTIFHGNLNSSAAWDLFNEGRCRYEKQPKHTQEVKYQH